MQACGDSLFLSEEERDCLADSLEGFEEEGKRYLDCANPVMEDYGNCLSMNPGCEAGWYDDCTVAYQDAIEMCPELPDGARNKFITCDL
ncbi:hypothetical protein G6O69_36820 [Pseudenhygromyxa sp. WMMC2535]|uniref:hypothetical protein n=1 Tax=Pseudenhygromyxa sp. WMMC2535 TaxID=2712867 RepID=UPI001595E952|nr:hypothetical protein [Pseudenhygromyxa sp. WMMC2535]NVB37243.1 hypothetical protein [Pseudenhygromyxa sp. WMMC2535]NVB43445.1 hypothetical protein [Pseudenhygromyxa sp. WMMC2535]